MIEIFKKYRSRNRMELDLPYIILAIIAFALILGIVYEYQTTEFRKDALEDYTNELMSNIEEDGYITNETIYQVEMFAEEIGADYVNIEGSFEEVSAGDKLFLTVEVYDKNYNGGEITRAKSIKEGVSK